MHSKTVVKSNRQSFDIKLLVLFTLSILIIELTLSNQRFVNEDSDSYIHFANILAGGYQSVIAASWSNDFILGFRTPGYPLLLALGNFVTGSMIPGMVLIHFLVPLATLWFACGIVSRRAEKIACLVGLLAIYCQAISPGSFYTYRATLMTEWVAIHTIVCLILSLVQALRIPSFRSFSILSFIGAYAALVRPDLFSLMCMILLATFINAFCRKSLRLALALFIGFSPALLWILFNFMRFDHITFSPFGGMNFLGIGGLISSPEAQDSDSPALRKFINEVNIRKFKVLSGNDFRKEGNFDINKDYNALVWQVGAVISTESNLTLPQLNDYSFEYTKRAILRSPTTYLDYVIHQINLAWFQLALGLPLTIIAVLLIFTSRDKAFGVAGFAMLAIHYGHILMIALISVGIERYLDLTTFPLFLISLLSLTILYSKKGDSECAESQE